MNGIVRMRCSLLLVVAAILNPGCLGSLSDEMAEYTQVCCGAGETHAQKSSDCSTGIPPKDVPDTFGSICLFAMDRCCKEHHKDKTECEKGKKLVANKQCNQISSHVGQNCCEECSVGRLQGLSAGREGCGGMQLSGSDEAGPSTKLRKAAYTACCLEAAAEIEPVQETTSSKPTPTPPPKGERAASICEQFAPDELCAHHCVPVPGSYRCTCNAGYQLMADGKSCRKLEKDRCKPRNHCQHKCTDTGKKIKCSCRRGYELMPDGKSCRDVDECVLEIAVCAAGTVCRNTEGSYKCAPPTASLSGPTCPAGFQRNLVNQVCDDINECELPSPPCARSICVNTIGGYTCGGVPGRPTTSPAPAAKPLAVPATTPRQQDLCPNGFRIGDDGDCVDINECTESADDCNRQSQNCLNTHGGFVCQDKASRHCPPGFKMDKATGICKDIDECADTTDLCGAEMKCVNVAGAYDCKDKSTLSTNNKRPKNCPEGTRINPSLEKCEDIDECMEGSHLCDNHQDCLNTYGAHECRCKIGFRIDPTTGACEDVNECAEEGLNECVHDLQRCDNTVGSYVCTRFISCGTGYVLHASSGQCEDVDECAHGLHNCAQAGPDFTCVNLPGTFRCVRRRANTTTTTTTTLSPYEYEYYDEDEDIPTEPVDPKPTDKEPSPVAPPPPSFVSPSPTTPLSPPSSTSTTSEPPKTNPQEEEIDITTTTRPVPPPRVPYPKPKPKTPKVVIRPQNDTLVLNTGQLPKDTWTNIVRPSKPERPSINLDDKHCIAGYFMDEHGDCVDVDECAKGSHVCSSLTEVCRNTLGGYQCDCAPGFVKDTASGWCRALAAPTTATPKTSTSTTTTTTTTASTTTTTTTSRPTRTWTPPTGGGRTPWSPAQWPYRPFRPRLQCDVGYKFDPNSEKCEDVDECLAGLATCAAHEICINTEGGYRCECPPGWTLDSSGQRCVPLRQPPASFPSGYHNIDSDAKAPPGGTPVSSGGGAADRTITVGATYGTQGPARLAPTYTQTEGGVIATCPWGYRLSDHGLCEDIDECSRATTSGKPACGSQQTCANHAGGYSCRCAAGYRLAADDRCEDVDECAMSDGRVCSSHASCINTPGSFRCQCFAGLRSAPANDRVCVDIDECAEPATASACQHTCHNVWGGFRCGCKRGYRLAADNRTCSDVDECVEFASRRPCVGRCLNEPGSYRCSCPPGYRLAADSRSCIDIDECETGTAPCAGASATPDRVCQNTRGGYRCHRVSCPPGYKLERKHRCTLESSTCPPGDTTCLTRPSTYSYNFITFVSRLYIPPPPAARVDLFTMRGPSWPNSRLQFQLKMISVDAPPSVKKPADIGCFLMTTTPQQAVVSLLESLEGPQSIELELEMTLLVESTNPYSRQSPYGGKAVAKLSIYVSEYEF